MHSDIAIEVNSISKTYATNSSSIRAVINLLFGSKKTYDGFNALQDISFSIRRGETLGIIGRNGAGKSTLLQIIAGTLSQTSGIVRVNGRLAALLELGAGFNPDFTGRENIYLSASVYGLTKAEIEQEIDSIVAFAEIGAFIDQPVKTYSSGMFVRLAFSIIAHVKADILVIDEALAVGDIYFTQKCMRFLKSFTKDNTLIFVSHDTHSITQLCDKAIWIDRGKIRLNSNAKSVSDAYITSFYEENEQQPLNFEIDNQDIANDSNEAIKTNIANIVSCELLDSNFRSIKIIDCAQKVSLKVNVVCNGELKQPIIGFYISDRLGQPICGFNTTQVNEGGLTFFSSNSKHQVTFEFWMPLLATGSYTISVAIADGTQEQHTQHHWIHDIIAFKSEADPHLVGIFETEQRKVCLHQVVMA